MIKTQNNIASFVLRFTQELWRDAQGEPHVQWRGHIRHVQGDEEDRFTDFAEAVAFIQRYLTQLTLEALEALRGGQPMNQEKVLQESFKVWEQFASSYTDMMFETMQHTVKQSEAFREQFDQAAERALKAWQLSPPSPNKQLVEAINSLQAQVQVLTSKVETLEKSLQQVKTGQE